MATHTMAGSAVTPEADTGVRGNARLTAVAGLLLAAMLLVEGVTVLDVRGMITLHLFLGLMLIPPVLLKTAGTVYRMGSYYRGRDAYVQRGAPPIVLRLIGPLVVLSSLSLLGTGLWLLLLDRHDDAVLTLHQASFIVWVVLMTVHFLGHIREAVVESWHEVRPRSGGDPVARRRSVRLAAVALSLVAGVGLATALMPSSTAAWQHHDRFGQRFDH
ncbi:MAG: hypothetical protein ACTHMS_01990 [Jatrophihabitans sp.]|uniref:hypothetical protein n=1 Tax=Jatrophihabitans sp. TaxID=1932789 RepID=UPI003F80811A